MSTSTCADRSSFILHRSSSPLVMGILNITPDSFSDGGVHFDHVKALHAALQMEADGAAIIDIGGESTR
ncbi:MAG: dihydropteroate synthase, partial [Acidobacteriota bacterium]|nr:dihydropteroate synthase [Acidobacteriota bacterium]